MSCSVGVEDASAEEVEVGPTVTRAFQPLQSVHRPHRLIAPLQGPAPPAPPLRPVAMPPRPLEPSESRPLGSASRPARSTPEQTGGRGGNTAAGSYPGSRVRWSYSSGAPAAPSSETTGSSGKVGGNPAASRS